MAQTGMPGKKGDDKKDKDKDKGTSIWGHSFDDEIRLPALRHNARGVVSMANRGTAPGGGGTNGSQFFVTFARAAHLDGANTVFGRLLGDASFETLDRLEAVPVDKKYRPKMASPDEAPPRIERVTIHANPLAK